MREIHVPTREMPRPIKKGGNFYAYECLILTRFTDQDRTFRMGEHVS